jgi:4-carboxymuconolactone decarboxylase
VATATVEKNLEAMGRGDAPVLEQLVQMTVDTQARSGLDDRTYALTRIAALVTADAAPVSYLLNLGTAAEHGVTAQDIQGTLVAIAPIVGTARIASAAGNIMGALGLAEAIADDD